MSENQVHFIYEEQDLGDLICADGSKAILVDGQYIVTDSQAILLQDGDANLTQYYINDNEGFVVDGEDSSANTLFEQTECVQLIEEDTSDGQQIIYYTNDDTLTPVEDLTEGIQDEDGNIYPFKRIKLEGQLLNFDEFIHQQQEENEEETVEYTVIEGDKEPEKNDEEEQVVDLSKITGKNLITGQTVTLHSYMEKLKKRLTKSNNTHLGRKSPKKMYIDGVNVPLATTVDEAKKSDLSDLLDKKISIGKTRSGKRIVGKIIHVEKRDNANRSEPEEENNIANSPPLSLTEEIEEVPKIEEETKILVKKCAVSIESFEQISKTLGGVMEMESVRKKLENKNIVVKLVEKKYNSETDSYTKSTSYSYGYMEQEMSAGFDEELVEKWKFVPDQETQDVLLGDEVNKTTKFPITTSLTILIIYEKTGSKTVRVNLNPAPGNLCTICAQYFKTNLQLRQHMNLVHNTYSTNITCEICDKTFEDSEKIQEHRIVHVQEGKLFICSTCSKCFATEARLQKHLPIHDVYLRPLECSVCEVRCASEWALKKHLLTHTGIKPYACEVCGKQFTTQYDLTVHKKTHFPEKHFMCNICMRTFSRHSNLLRHTEIHKGNGALYKCDICYCSYNYISSLTRHMVQNHIEPGELKKKDKAESGDC